MILISYLICPLEGQRELRDNLPYLILITRGNNAIAIIEMTSCWRWMAEMEGENGFMGPIPVKEDFMPGDVTSSECMDELVDFYEYSKGCSKIYRAKPAYYEMGIPGATDKCYMRLRVAEHKKELDKLISMDCAQRKSFVLEGMRLKVYINNIEAQLDDVVIDESGILLDMSCVGEALSSAPLRDVMVEIGFVMPMLKSDCKLLASISEPTYSPIIELSYPEDKYKVTMLPFLNGNTSSKDAMHYDGICEIVVNDDWIMPMSGVAFLISVK